MLYYTHLIVALFFALFLFPKFGLVFFIVMMVSSLLPDIDTKYSKFGRRWFFRPLQFFIRHRGILHSFVFLIIVSLVLFLLSREIAYGFFLGYGLHLFLDKIGIKAGSPLETLVFVVFLVGNLGLIFWKVLLLF